MKTIQSKSPADSTSKNKNSTPSKDIKGKSWQLFKTDGLPNTVINKEYTRASSLNSKVKQFMQPKPLPEKFKGNNPKSNESLANKPKSDFLTPKSGKNS